MGKKGWGEIDRERGADSRFLQVADGEIKIIRLLDDEPFTIHVHQVKGDVDGKEVFRSIPATESPDEDWIDQQTNRFPAQPRHAMRCIEIDDDGEIQGIKVLMGGVQIFRPLKKAFLAHGDVTGFDFAVSRTGEGVNTEWDVAPCPESYDLDVEEWKAEMEADDSLAWDAIFPSITPDEQQKIVAESRIDVTFDPVEALLGSMSMAEAKATRLTFGKYGPQKNPPSGLTVGEAFALDPSWVTWAAYNVTNHDQESAACRIVSEGKTLTKAKKAKEIEPPKKKAKAAAQEDEGDGEAPTRDDWKGAQSVEDYLARWFTNGGKRVELALAILEGEGLTWPPESDEPEDEEEDEEEIDGDEPDEDDDEDEDEDEEEDDEEEDDDEDEEEDDEDEGTVPDRQGMIDQITEIFADRFSDTSSIIAVVKKFGKGNPRMRDLSDAQLLALLEHLESGEAEEAPKAAKAPAKKKAIPAPAKKAMKKAAPVKAKKAVRRK